MSNFHFFVPITKVEKSAAISPDKDINVKISGIISTNKKDFQNESLDQQKMDFSYLEKSGRVKYEHNKDPKYFIGVPGGTLTIGQETEIFGNIFAKANTPQHDIARQCLGDIENVEAWNKLHPENPRKIGFSIEGGMVVDSQGKFVKGICKDVVITQHPINDDTFIKIYKSFEAGNATSISDMTGSQAGRKQHLDGTGVFKMKFNSKKECKDYLLSKGLPEDEANQKAEAWEKYENERKARTEKISKSIAEAEAAITEANNFSTGRNIDYTPISKSFTDLTTPDKDNNIDAQAFLKSVGESIVDQRKEANTANIEIAKLLAINFALVKSMFETMASINEGQEDSLALVKSLSEENEDLKSRLDKMDTSVITKGLEALNLAGRTTEGGGSGSGTEGEEKYKYHDVLGAISKAMLVDQEAGGQLHNLLMESKVTYELNKKFDVIHKSIAPLVEKHLSQN